MARSLLKAAADVAVSMSISNATRRVYSAAAAVAVSSKPSGVRGRSSGVVNRAGEEASADPNSWVPDPVSGYYRPANRAAEVDVAELRRVLLSHKSP